MPVEKLQKQIRDLPGRHESFAVEAIEKAQGTLDAQTTQLAKQLILGNLRDPDVGVRTSTVLALGKFGGTDMIPALEEVAANDPAPGVDGHSIRKSAAEAIAEIQRRAGNGREGIGMRRSQKQP